MAGYTDLAFRRTLIKCGARVVWTEMVSAAALYHNSKKTLELLRHDKIEGVKNVVQIFGKDPKHFDAAIRSGVLEGFDEININMGCPAPKIIRNGEGGALMSKPELAREIVETCVKATSLPMSVKMRLDNVMEIAKICEQAGASRLIVHGRYIKQGYSGTADWDAIADVVRGVNIPVIANGDIRNHDDAVRCLKVTCAAGVMMGRALIGSPWNISDKELNINEIIDYHLKQAEICNINPNEMKKHILLYRRHKNCKQ